MDQLFYYSKSANKSAGKGVNEKALNYNIYNELNKIKDWRKILSNLYFHEFSYDGKIYNSIEHAFQAKKIELKHASLIQRAVELIESFNLSAKITRWLNLSDSNALLGAMLNSNRAGNFIQDTDERMLKNILKSSF